jgi:hypothetical protein
VLLNTAESGVERISAKILVANVHTSGASSSAPDRKRERSQPIIIIIHFLGRAPVGYLAAPDNGA